MQPPLAEQPVAEEPVAEQPAASPGPLTPKARINAMLDTDGDGVASRHDYFVRIDRAQQAAGRADDADADQDGALDRSQFTLLRRALGNRADNVDAAFEALDSDGDGYVSRAQYLASIRAYVTGDDSPMGDALY